MSDIDNLCHAISDAIVADRLNLSRILDAVDCGVSRVSEGWSAAYAAHDLALQSAIGMAVTKRATPQLRKTWAGHIVKALRREVASANELQIFAMAEEQSS